MANEQQMAQALTSDNFGYAADEADIIIREIMMMPDGEEKDQLLTQLYQDYAGQEHILEEKITRATQEMDIPTPEGRQAGEVYVAADPLEHMAAALRRGMGGIERKQSMEGLKGLSDDRGAATEFAGRALMKYDEQQGMSTGEPAMEPAAAGPAVDSGMSVGEPALTQPAGVGSESPTAGTLSPNYQPMPEPAMVPSHFIGGGPSERELAGYLRDMDRQKLPMGPGEAGPGIPAQGEIPSHFPGGGPQVPQLQEKLKDMDRQRLPMGPADVKSGYQMPMISTHMPSDRISKQKLRALALRGSGPRHGLMEYEEEYPTF